MMAQSGASPRRAAPVLARAHHGSVSKEQRAADRGGPQGAAGCPAVVATSSLELGIDMGAVDLVVQVESPPSRGQRPAAGRPRRPPGRRGLARRALPQAPRRPRADRGRRRADARRRRSRRCACPRNPLDVLAQQVVAMLRHGRAGRSTTLVDAGPPRRAVRRAAALGATTRCSTCSPAATRATSSPSCARASSGTGSTGTLTGRPGAQRLAVTSGGTIPDRGLFGVFLVVGEGPGRRVGELDEEMVYESRVGDVFTLGATHLADRGHHPRPGAGHPGARPARAAAVLEGRPLGRPAELGRAIGAFVRELGGADPGEAPRAGRRRPGSTTWAADNLRRLPRRAARGHRPRARRPHHGGRAVPRRARRLAARRALALRRPGARALGAGDRRPAARAVRRRRAGDARRRRHRAAAARLELDDGRGRADVAELAVLDPDEVERARHRRGRRLGAVRRPVPRVRGPGPAAAPPRPRPALSRCGSSASARPSCSRSPASTRSFPIVLEAVRECLQDVYDVPGLVDADARRRVAREVRVVEVETPQPVAVRPQSLLFGYVAQFLYEGDSPLAERRAAALSLDPRLLAELLGRARARRCASCSTPRCSPRIEAELQRLTARARGPATPRASPTCSALLGPLSTDGGRAPRCVEPAPTSADWLADARATRAASIRVRVAGEERWAADRGRRPAARRARRRRCRSGVPRGLPRAGRRPARRPGRPLRPHPRPVHRRRRRRPARARRRGRAPTPCAGSSAHGRVVEGEFRPAAAPAPSGATPRCCARCAGARWPRCARRSSRSPAVDARPGSCRPGRASAAGCAGVEGVLRVVEQLAGCARARPAPSSRWCCPARVADYSPALLDELTAAGEVLWAGHGRAARRRRLGLAAPRRHRAT